MSDQPASNTLRLAGVLGFLGVALGAFGAHWLKPALKAFGTESTWETGVIYHLVHAVALLAVGLSARPVSAWVSRLFLLGIMLFSGSLYWLATAPTAKWLGPVTPIGGLCFLAGWLWLIFTARR